MDLCRGPGPSLGPPLHTTRMRRIIGNRKQERKTDCYDPNRIRVHKNNSNFYGLFIQKTRKKVSKRKGKYILYYLQTHVMLKGMRFSKVGQTLMLVTPIQAALPFVTTTTKFYARNLQNPDTGLRNVNASETYKSKVQLYKKTNVQL